MAFYPVLEYNKRLPASGPFWNPCGPSRLALHFHSDLCSHATLFRQIFSNPSVEGGFPPPVSIIQLCFIFFINIQHHLKLSCSFAYCLMCVCLLSYSVMPDSATPWTVARPAPRSMGFSTAEYWNGLPLPPPGDLPSPGIEPTFSALAGGFFTTESPRKPYVVN